MTDVGVREFGAFAPGTRNEPTVPPLSLAPAAEAPAAAGLAAREVARPAALAVPGVADALGIDAPVGRLADLAAHRETVVPLTIGLLGGAGSGKSFALRRLVQHLDAPSVGSEAVRSIQVLVIDAASLDDEPALALAAAVHAGLREPYPELARDIAHTARDPHVVAREVNERLDEARRRLDGERRALDDAGSRLARLTETVLYDAAGSGIDSYACAHRAGIEGRLIAFGLTGDPIRTYKDLARTAAESGTVGLWFRALTAYKGQTRLIVLAVLLVAVGVGLGIALDTQDSWLESLRNGPQVAATIGMWLDAHINLIVLAREAAFALAVLALVTNLWRAFAFVGPIAKGARLLKVDLAERRRDLDGVVAHGTKRVDDLAGEVERLTAAAREAEMRLGGAATRYDPPPFESGARAQAGEVLRALGRSLHEGTAAKPERILLAVDGFDAVPPARARLLLDALHRATTSGGLMAAVAFDPKAVDASRDDLERWIDVPFHLDAHLAHGDPGALVQQMLGRAPEPVAAPARAPLDRVVNDDEATMLAALAPLAGMSPRAIKRFVSLYTLARQDAEGGRGALALALALALGGTPAERQAAEQATTGAGGARFAPRPSTPRFEGALRAADALDGPITARAAADAAARVSLFSVSAP